MPILILFIILMIVVGINFTYRSGQQAVMRKVPAAFKTGMNSVSTGASDMRPIQTVPKVDDDTITALFEYFESEGFDKVADPMEYHLNPLLTEMLESINRREPLEWVLPKYHIRVVPITDRFPESFQGFDRAVIVSGHAVGYNVHSN